MRERMHRPDDPMYLAGKADGRKWGADIAQPAELEHVQRLYGRVEGDPAISWDWYFFENTSPYPVYQQLAMDLTGVDPEEIHVEEEAEAFWHEVHGRNVDRTKLQNGAYLQGFTDGALEIWDQRSDRV